MPEPTPQSAVEGNETVLVVEDEDDLREMAVLILESFGYSVLSARSGPEAFQVWADHTNAIQIMITDMVMPGGISGAKLVMLARGIRPGIKVLLTSGFAKGSVQGSEEIPPGVEFLSKPYRRAELAAKLRGVLDGKS